MQNAGCKIRSEMKENASVEKSFEFAVRIVKLYKYLVNEHKEYVLSRQLLRCGTSIGANVAEAQRGQSKADFAAKMSIALKEANETEYWLKLLHRTEYLSQSQFSSMNADIQELIGILTAICRTANNSK
jgi:four helix bundle protein